MNTEQKKFLISLLSQVTIKASDADSAKVVEMVRSIIELLSLE